MAKDDKDAKGKKDAKPAKPPAQDARPAKEAKQPKQPKGDKPVGKQAAPTQPARLQVHYRETVVPALMKQFGYKTVMQVPRIEKITLNMGVGEAVADKKILDNAVGRHGEDRRPEARDHQVAQVDRRLQDPRRLPGRLHGDAARRRMYEFLDRLVTIAMPRIRDFRGVSGRAFDGRGNYNIGVKEQIIFPEIEYDKIDALRGMNISITTTAKTDDEARALLAAFNFPFRN